MSAGEHDALDIFIFTHSSSKYTHQSANQINSFPESKKTMRPKEEKSILRTN